MVHRVTTSDNEWQRVARSGTTSDYNWYNEWQRMTTNRNEWQRVTRSGTTSDKEWQWVAKNDDKWQRVTASESSGTANESDTVHFKEWMIAIISMTKRDTLLLLGMDGCN